MIIHGIYDDFSACRILKQLKAPGAQLRKSLTALLLTLMDLRPHPTGYLHLNIHIRDPLMQTIRMNS